MNLLAIGGASDAAQGQQGPHFQMLQHYSQHWDRIDIITLGGPGASPRTLFGNVHLHPNPGGRLRHMSFIRRQGRALMADPMWPLRAAETLQAKNVTWPVQYERSNIFR